MQLRHKWDGFGASHQDVRPKEHSCNLPWVTLRPCRIMQYQNSKFLTDSEYGVRIRRLRQSSSSWHGICIHIAECELYLADGKPTAVPLSKERKAKCAEMMNRGNLSDLREEVRVEEGGRQTPAPMATVFVPSAITGKLTSAGCRAGAGSARNVEPE